MSKLSKFLGSCSKVLHSMRPALDPTEDYLNIVSAEEQMIAKAAQRQKELEIANSELNGQLIPI